MANPCSAVAPERLVHSDSQKSWPNAAPSRNCRAGLHWWRQVPGGLLLPRRILTCLRSQMICPAGSRLELAMSSRAVAGAKELFASICDISNFPTAGTSICRPMLRIARARRGGGARGGGQSENNFARRNRPRRPSVEWTAPGGVPPSPQPSPIRRETLAPFWRRGLPLMEPLWKTRRENSGTRLRVHACARYPCGAGVGAGLADLSPSGRNPARFFAG
jgi:hypothetical protein